MDRFETMQNMMAAQEGMFSDYFLVSSPRYRVFPHDLMISKYGPADIAKIDDAYRKSPYANAAKETAAEAVPILNQYKGEDIEWVGFSQPIFMANNALQFGRLNLTRRESGNNATNLLLSNARVWNVIPRLDRIFKSKLSKLRGIPKVWGYVALYDDGTVEYGEATTYPIIAVVRYDEIAEYLLNN